MWGDMAMRQPWYHDPSSRLPTTGQVRGDEGHKQLAPLPSVMGLVNVPGSKNISESPSDFAYSITDPKIPQDLIDEIIDHTYSEAHALATFSLVCRAWLPSTRYHLFSDVVLRPSNTIGFLDLFASPLSTIATYVRRIEFQGCCFTWNPPLFRWGECWLNDIIPRLPQLMEVASLSLVSLDFLGLGTKTSLSNHFVRVRDLSLSGADIQVETFDQVTGFISAFPLLERLTLDFGIRRWESGYTPQVGEPPAPCLQYLSLLSRGQKDDVLKWLLRRKPLITHSARFLWVYREETPFIGAYLETLGPALKFLDISFQCFTDDESPRLLDEAFSHNIDLVHNNELARLHFTDLVLEKAWEFPRPTSVGYISVILSQITSPLMEEIRFQITLESHEDIDTFDWSSIALTLDRPQFSGLRAVRFDIGRWYIKETLTEWRQEVTLARDKIRKFLPACARRGILSFSE